MNACCEKTLLDQRNAQSGYLQGQPTFAPIRFIRIRGAGANGSQFQSDPRLWLPWARINNRFEFSTPVVLVFMPGVLQLEAGNAGSSMVNFVYATPGESRKEDSAMPTAEVGNYLGAGIVALRSIGQCLWLPAAGEWLFMYPEAQAAFAAVFDARDPHFARWLCDSHATYHALSMHDEDVDIPVFDPDDVSTIVEIALANRWRRYISIQNTGTNPVRVLTTTSPEVGPYYAVDQDLTYTETGEFSVDGGDEAFNSALVDFVADGWAVGDLVRTSGFANGANNGVFEVLSVTANALEVDANLVNEGSPATDVTLERVFFHNSTGWLLDPGEKLEFRERDWVVAQRFRATAKTGASLVSVVEFV